MNNLKTNENLMYPLRFLTHTWGYAYPRLGTAAQEKKNLKVLILFSKLICFQLDKVQMRPIFFSPELKTRRVEQIFAHIHTNTHIYTCILTHIHTNTHIYTNILTHTYTYILTHIHIHTNTHIHTHKHTFIAQETKQSEWKVRNEFLL